MTRDIKTSSKMSKKASKTKNGKSKDRKREEITRRRKSNESSDDDEDGDEYSSCSDDEEDEMDVHEYRKFISKIFPSKHLNQKIKSGEKLKKVLDNESSE